MIINKPFLKFHEIQTSYLKLKTTFKMLTLCCSNCCFVVIVETSSSCFSKEVGILLIQASFRGSKFFNQEIIIEQFLFIFYNVPHKKKNLNNYLYFSNCTQ